jgi:hypothetical protein
LPQHLESIREFATQAASSGARPEQTVELLFEELRGLDLTDRENLEPVTRAIAAAFPPAVLTAFLASVEERFPGRRQPTPEEMARLERQTRLMQVGRRGPYGTYGPGVLLPVGAEIVNAATLGLSELIANLFGSAAGLVSGVYDGFASSVSAAQAARFGARLAQSTVLNAVFPPLFLSGAGVGIIEDVVETVKGLYQLVTNLSEIAGAVLELIGSFFTADGAQVARELGVEIGKEYAGKITSMLDGNIFEFTFNLGRLVGPMIVYTVLAFLGVPQLIGAAVVGRLLQILRPLLQRFPRLVGLVGRVLRRAPDPRRPIDPEIDEAVERAFSEMPGEAAPAPLPGQGVVGPMALTRVQIAAARRLVGNNVGDLPLLHRIWNDVANPGERAILDAGNSRRLFNNHRRRFWRAVRDDAQARRMFEDAGFEFPPGPTTSPVHVGVPGRQGRISLDHITRRADDRTRALDADNLRLVVHGDNTLLENLQQAIPTITDWE